MTTQHPPPIITTRTQLAGRTLAEIIINRPGKRNALTPAMLHTIARHADNAANDPDAHAILLTGEGDTFSAGFDLDACADQPDALERLLRTLAVTIATLQSAPKPVVIAVQGVAVAGAAALLAAADHVIAHQDTRFGYPVIRLGISPVISAPSLLDALTPGNARARLLNPTLINAHRARDLGWISTIVDTPEDVRPRAQTIAAELASAPPDAFAATKRWLAEFNPNHDPTTANAARDASLAIADSKERHRLLAAALNR